MQVEGGGLLREAAAKEFRQALLFELVDGLEVEPLGAARNDKSIATEGPHVLLVLRLLRQVVSAAHTCLGRVTFFFHDLRFQRSTLVAPHSFLRAFFQSWRPCIFNLVQLGGAVEH